MTLCEADRNYLIDEITTQYLPREKQADLNFIFLRNRDLFGENFYPNLENRYPDFQTRIYYLVDELCRREKLDKFLEIVRKDYPSFAKRIFVSTDKVYKASNKGKIINAKEINIYSSGLICKKLGNRFRVINQESKPNKNYFFIECYNVPIIIFAELDWNILTNFFGFYKYRITINGENQTDEKVFLGKCQRVFVLKFEEEEVIFTVTLDIKFFSSKYHITLLDNNKEYKYSLI